MKFNSSLNPDWYLGDDGNCYSTALANIKIKPGESKELTLLLTKRVTDEEIIIDETEILEEYNEKGVESFAILNGDSRINSASIEVIRKAPDYTLFLILVVVFAITLTGGSMIYMEKESIGNNKFIRRIITKAKSIMRNKN